MIDQASRRNFLKFSTLSTLGLLSDPFNVVHSHSTHSPSTSPGNKGDYRITLLQTTDVHCQLHPHDELFWENDKSTFRKTGGYAHLASYFATIKSKNPNTFIVDTGDMFQGSQLSVETTGKAIQPILNNLPYDLYMPGNWEVVYGKKNMLDLMKGLSAPTVCTNMFHDTGVGMGDFIFKPFHVWEVAGIRIGFLAYTDPLVPIRQSPEYSKGILYTHPEENLEKYIRLLREDQRCQYIVLLSHLGLSQQIALANDPSSSGADIIFGGDTHERVRHPIQGKYCRIVEPGAFGSFVGRLELSIENGKVVGEEYFLDEIDPIKFPADPKIISLTETLEQPFRGKMDKILGYSTIPLYRYFVVENTIDTLVVDALHWKTGSDIVLSNGFRFCPPRNTPDDTGLIPITESFLYDMLPVDAVIRTGSVTGHQLMEWLENELNNVFAKDASQRFGGWLVKFNGMKMKFEAFAHKGNRIKSLLINNKPVQLTARYSISACEREGDPYDMLCRIKDVKDAHNTKWTLHGAVIDYLNQHSPITPKPHENAIVLDAPSTMLTQVTGVDYEFK